MLQHDSIQTVKSLIADFPDYPKPGILFRDITPLLRDPSGLALSIELLANPFRGKHIDVVVGAESRGFIFGTAVACCLSAGFGLVRKPGKLPGETIKRSYGLEYGQDCLEMRRDTLKPGQRVLIVDDVLATGGTLEACCKMVEELGGNIVAGAVLIELTSLKARNRIPIQIHSVLQYA